jgi:hypothetical protein
MNRLFGRSQIGSLLILFGSLAAPPQATNADTVPGGVRFIGNTWNQALIAVPPNLSHAEFVNEGGKIGSVKLHMLQSDCVVLDIDGKKYEVQAEPGGLSAMWLNEYVADMENRIDKQRPYLTQSMVFGILQNGQPYNFQSDATIAKAVPFRTLPANMKSMTVRVTTSPNRHTIVEPLSVDLLK